MLRIGRIEFGEEDVNKLISLRTPQDDPNSKSILELLDKILPIIIDVLFPNLSIQHIYNALILFVVNDRNNTGIKKIHIEEYFRMRYNNLRLHKLGQRSSIGRINSDENLPLIGLSSGPKFETPDQPPGSSQGTNIMSQPPINPFGSQYDLGGVSDDDELSSVGSLNLDEGTETGSPKSPVRATISSGTPLRPVKPKKTKKKKKGGPGRGGGRQRVFTRKNRKKP